MVLSGGRCRIGAHRHGDVIVAMGAALEARRGEAASGKERIHGGESRKGERKMFLYRTNVGERVFRERASKREERRREMKDKEEDFLLTRGFSPLCGGALRHPARTMHFSHTFFRIYLPIGCIRPVYQPRMQETKLRRCHRGRFRYFFFSLGETVNRIPGSMMQQILDLFFISELAA